MCSGASNSFGGAMMIFFDVCCDVSASSQKNEDVFVKDDDFLPLFPNNRVVLKRKSTQSPLFVEPQVLFKETPSLRNQDSSFVDFFCFRACTFCHPKHTQFPPFFPFFFTLEWSSCVHIFFISSSSHRLHFICAHPKRHSCNSFRNYSWPSGR